MKICCISDLHATLPSLPYNIDLILIAGDIAWHRTTKDEEVWFNKHFNPWLQQYNVPCIMIGGNHDFYLEEYKNKNIPSTYLENSSVLYNDIEIFGMPLSLEVGPWVWQAKEEDINDILKHVKCDILISHGPPFGYGDVSNHPTPNHCGSKALKDWIINFQPILVINGHIHESRGIYKLGETTIVNCCVTDDMCRAIDKVYVIDYDNKAKKVIDINEWNSITNQYSGRSHKEF